MFFKLIYNILFITGFLVTWPYYFYRMRRRGNFRQHFGERFGFYKPETIQKIQALQKPIWIHAVSVGEMMIAKVLIRELRAQNPKQSFLITTTTQTGRQIGQSLADSQTVLLYFPMDFFWISARAFRLIRPAMLVLVESEVWPNLIWNASKNHVPICMLNARLSARSEKRYKLLRQWISPLLEKITWIGVQHEEDLERLIQAGFPPRKLFVTGSLKFDVADLGKHNPSLAGELQKSLGWEASDPVLLAGSTAHGEEAVFLRVFEQLKKEFPKLRLILAPRHAERAPGVIELCGGVSAVRRSMLNGVPKKSDVMVLDTTGELASLYPLGNIIFIGKSLQSKGGQNFIEAVRFGKPVVFGPQMQNFAQLVEIFKKDNGILQVQNEEELLQTLRRLLSSPNQCAEIGHRAQEIFQENLGAGRKSASMVAQMLN